jgi:hypothetical protein
MNPEGQPVATREELADEARRLSRVRTVVDVTSNLIMQSGLHRGEAEALVALARQTVLELFPGREETFEIVYARRFQRLVDEFAHPDSRNEAIILPFPEHR